MSSIILGYNYDIFISYRQKDNKHDGWVTEFVDDLKGELEATFKEEISVYFGINPHDGLLETHDVDASLKDKLKCLIFISIISRTYCDPKSFAWEHEFKAFIEQAAKDQFGLKVKLPSGNVANRILPVQIHEITAADKVHIEKELGGVLRAIEFIYKEPGVNKPLTSNDDEKLNLNKTKYRIQINKVANSIDEIISGLKAEPTLTAKEKTPTAKEPIKEDKKEERREQQENPAKLNKRKLLSGVAILAILIIAAVFSYPKIFKRDALEKLRSSGRRISVAVMPFQNMTNDTTWSVWQDGIQDILINSLSTSVELRVIQTESIKSLIQGKGITNYASITPSMASVISQTMDANVFIYGSIKQAGPTIRINAQLIDSKTKEVLKPFQIEGPSKEEVIFRIIDSLSTLVRNFLVISKLGKEITPDLQSYASTNSPEAYRYFIYGLKSFRKFDFPTAVKCYSQAIAIDSNFSLSALQLIFSFGNQRLYEDAKKWCLKAYEKMDQLPVQWKIMTNFAYAYYFETPDEEIKYLKQALEIDNQAPSLQYNLGISYIKMNQYDKAIIEFEEALAIYKKWGIKPFWSANYSDLGYAYHKIGQYRKEKRLYKMVERDYPDNPEINYQQAVLALTQKNVNAANEYIETYKSILNENSSSEADINTGLAYMYSEAGIIDKAEEYLRKALILEHEKPERMNNLAYFLIDKGRNLNEGMELVDKALVSTPDDYNYLHTKGWGLYKQLKYKAAFEILQKSWDLRMKNAIYDHEAYLHLEAAKRLLPVKRIIESSLMNNKITLLAGVNNIDFCLSKV